jgi:hypothetical protein
MKGKYLITPPFYPLDPYEFCLDDSIFVYVTSALRKRRLSVISERGIAAINGTDLEMAEWPEEKLTTELKKRQQAIMVADCYATCGM